MLRIFLCLFPFFVLSGNSLAQKPAWSPAPRHITLPLWTHVPSNAPAEVDVTTAKDSLVAGKTVIRLSNISNPTITLYAPSGKNSGAAVVVFPGGGYRLLAIDLEGTEVCDWLNSIGVTCVLLKYRVPDSGPFPKSSAAMEDAQRAVGMVRQRAAEWHIDPQRIGVLGFSAGGHLVAALSTHYEKRLYDSIDAADHISCRPDFQVLVYPAYLALPEQNFLPNPEVTVTEKDPPAFIVQTEDDPVIESATVYFMQLKRAKVPAEMHLYAKGGHGYGLRHTDLPVTSWPQLVEVWLHTLNVLPPPAP